MKLGASLVDCFHRIQQISGRPGQPIQLPDDKSIAGANLVEHSLKFRSLPIEAGNLLTEDRVASGLPSAPLIEDLDSDPGSRPLRIRSSRRVPGFFGFAKILA